MTLFTDEMLEKCWIAARSGNVEGLTLEEVEYVNELEVEFARMKAAGIAPSPSWGM